MGPVALQPKDYVVRDDSREIRFTGVRLAAASSQEVWKNRWTEMVLYRTVGGKYVLEIIGRSTKPREYDICTGTVCDSPDAVLNSLQGRRDGVEYLSWIARDLLEEAAAQDPAITEVYRQYHVE